MPDCATMERTDAELIAAGKSADQHTLSQDEINALLVQKGREGKRVVRLKGGDPFVFGRGGEEAEALAAAGVRFEVLPGVTSAIAAPAYAGIPVTHRAVASSFAVVTGSSPCSPLSPGGGESARVLPGGGRRAARREPADAAPALGERRGVSPPRRSPSHALSRPGAAVHFRPLGMCQSTTVASDPAEASRVPSGEKARS